MDNLLSNIKPAIPFVIVVILAVWGIVAVNQYFGNSNPAPSTSQSQ